MRKGALAMTGVGIALLFAAAALAAGELAGLERLKALAGEWEGKNKSGETARAVYEITANSTAVVEKLSVGPMETMVTVYHADGDSLMMTHYCGTGNQPRMRAEQTHAPGMLLFKFADATNLASPENGHMHNLALTFAGTDRLKQVWTWREKGQDRDEVIELARKK